MPCQLFAHLYESNCQEITKISKMFGGPPNPLPLVVYIGIFLLLGIITLQHSHSKQLLVGLMVLSQCMVHFLKIEENFNKSTKTILWL